MLAYTIRTVRNDTKLFTVSLMTSFGAGSGPSASMLGRDSYLGYLTIDDPTWGELWKE